MLASNKIAKQWIVCDCISGMQVHLQRGKEKVSFSSLLFKDLYCLTFVKRCPLVHHYEMSLSSEFILSAVVNTLVLTVWYHWY